MLVNSRVAAFNSHRDVCTSRTRGGRWLILLFASGRWLLASGWRFADWLDAYFKRRSEVALQHTLTVMWMPGTATVVWMPGTLMSGLVDGVGVSSGSGWLA